VFQYFMLLCVSGCATIVNVWLCVWLHTVIQERNSYAVSVWRKVKSKLDGKESEQSKRLTVAEQVWRINYIFKSMTDIHL